jgi:hypothetical protein
VSYNVFGKKQFGPGRYGQVGVDINALAGEMAKQMREAGEKNRRELAAQAAAKQYDSREELHCIAFRRTYGYMIESLGTVAGVTLVGRGASMDLAKADLRFQAVRLFVGTRSEPTWEAARNRATKMSVYIADTIDETGGLGSRTGKISVGAGTKR